jgi:DNA sulfur modification protein DndC
MHLELLAKLIDTERQYFLKISRKGIYKDLEKCFESSSRSKEEAIENARYVYDSKECRSKWQYCSGERTTQGEF